jgi:hypothetical protein
MMIKPRDFPHPVSLRTLLRLSLLGGKVVTRYEGSTRVDYYHSLWSRVKERAAAAMGFRRLRRTMEVTTYEPAPRVEAQEPAKQDKGAQPE